MDSPSILGLSLIVVLLVVIAYQRTKVRNDAVAAAETSDVAADSFYSVTYLGGHPEVVAERPVRVLLGIGDAELMLHWPSNSAMLASRESKTVVITYEKLLSARTETKESISASTMILVGILAFALKKKTRYLAISFLNDLDEESTILFEDHGNNVAWLSQTITEHRYRYLKSVRTGA